MGTETNACRHCIIIRNDNIVKLNNPLMGTETVFCRLLYQVRYGFLVKLNNPLMGTETPILFRHRVSTGPSRR